MKSFNKYVEKEIIKYNVINFTKRNKLVYKSIIYFHLIFKIKRIYYLDF
jgi:hypothetical protein